MTLIDSHCHLDAPEFDSDRDAVIERARAVGVHAQIVPAVSAAGFEDLLALARRQPGIHPAFGLHPMFLVQHQPQHLDQVTQFLLLPEAVAVGECGLDFFVADLDPDAQRDYFQAHLRMARAFDLPLIVHARRAVDEVIQSIRRVGSLRGVIHSFSGSAEQARQLWNMGFYLGIGGPVSYPRAQRLRRIVATMPLEYLLLESDAPDQPDCWHRGQRNEPALLPAIAEVIAELRGCTPADIAAATSSNARALFTRMAPPVPAAV